MVSFRTLWENMEAGRRGEERPDDRAVSAIRSGIGISEDFWDNFLLILNNSEGLSELLDVPSSKIGSWHQKVKSALEFVQKADSASGPTERDKLIKTGLPDLNPPT